MEAKVKTAHKSNLSSQTRNTWFNDSSCMIHCSHQTEWRCVTIWNQQQPPAAVTSQHVASLIGLCVGVSVLESIRSDSTCSSQIWQWADETEGKCQRSSLKQRKGWSEEQPVDRETGADESAIVTEERNETDPCPWWSHSVWVEL